MTSPTPSTQGGGTGGGGGGGGTTRRPSLSAADYPVIPPPPPSSSSSGSAVNGTSTSGATSVGGGSGSSAATQDIIPQQHAIDAPTPALLRSSRRSLSAVDAPGISTTSPRLASATVSVPPAASSSVKTTGGGSLMTMATLPPPYMTNPATATGPFYRCPPGSINTAPHSIVPGTHGASGPTSSTVGIKYPQAEGGPSPTATSAPKSSASSSGSGSNLRALNVKDALSYLDQVKFQFGHQPTVYNRFLDIMKDFKSQAIDTPGVIDRVAALFRGHPALIMGFNTFLPPGYRIESTNNPADPIRIVTPHFLTPYAPRPVDFSSSMTGISPTQPQLPTTTSTSGVPPSSFYAGTEAAVSAPSSFTPSSSGPIGPAKQAPAVIEKHPVVSQQQAVAPHPPQPIAAGSSSERRAPVEFNHAINFVNKIKTRFAREPETYKEFLEILQTYQKEQKPIHDVYAQVQVLFGNAPDLLEEFKQFLPDTSAPSYQRGAAGQGGKLPAGAPQQKQGKRVASSSASVPTTVAQPPPKKKTKTTPTLSSAALQPGTAQRTATTSDLHLPPKPINNMEELEFFDKCKKAIGNKATYNEFLKVLNLFSQEIIEAKILVDRVAPYLAKAPELFEWFKNFVKYDEEEIIYNVPAERPEFDLKTCRRSGHSYRMMPMHIPRADASGRNDLCRSVLNDDWISHPIFISESGFVAHRKNVYEEALFKCEEERYEFDRNIEANLHTIALLEPIAHRLQSMSPEEKAEFKLYPGLGGLSKTIYQRVIKSIYDRERGQEVIDALHDNPAIAVPVVLKRLKQKDEEWKRAQREWNKVWRDIDSKNFYKALDHQGISFKVTDRKSVNVKVLVNEIETLSREQKEVAALAPSSAAAVRAAGMTGSSARYQLDFAFKDEAVFRDVRLLLQAMLESSVSLTAADEERVNEGVVKTFLATFFFLDEQAYKDDRIQEGLGITTQREGGRVNAPRSAYPFYANTSFYGFFRIYQMIYSRLLKMKELSKHLSATPAHKDALNPLAVELGLQKATKANFNEADRYPDLFRSLISFVGGIVDPTEFEEATRAMYGTSAYLVFTLDKLAQAAIRSLQQIVVDAKSMELLALYYKDRAKATTSSRQEAVYRLSAETLTQEENTFRLEYFPHEKVLTVQILSQEDYILDETISSEEKWSLYVDHFVQLSKESALLKRKEPFLSRNLPKDIGNELPKNVFTHSGLELKICVNTYKIFFVDETEDFFFRKRSTAVPFKPRRSLAEVLNDPTSGWAVGLETEDCGAATSKLEAMFMGVVRGVASSSNPIIKVKTMPGSARHYIRS